ncbi:ferrochelatase [Lysinibacter sp. HNR]|uniref:ferrochelatase n=1 Tax=Lysinibacter sp. HNR TaxID=3031408 RepID=UPI0024352113|nr:ferrochelatase [Lysinibacter sp. HNR]WGD37825.1 ferrochelatase [Lysinibacter sp. HNR]
MSINNYDAILLSSFGGPEGQEDVIPFLKNVTHGRGIPEERLEEVAHHYRHFGGVSPINEQNRQLKAALEAELARREIDLPVYWGNRNWAPYFPEAVQEAYNNGHTRLLGLVTSAYTSYSGVGQYREDFEKCLAETGLTEVVSIDRIREFFDHPGFINPLVEGVKRAVSDLAAQGVSDGVRIVFVTHSIPNSAANESGPEFGEGGAYVAQHLAAAQAISDRAAPDIPWSLVYQSRSGDPRIPWLEPDINDAIEEMGAESVRGIVIVPFGFVSDHMEVLWDLDNEAIETAENNNIRAIRVPTPGIHPEFVSGLIDLVMERVNGTPVEERPALTPLGPWPDHPTVGAPHPGGIAPSAMAAS